MISLDQTQRVLLKLTDILGEGFDPSKPPNENTLFGQKWTNPEDIFKNLPRNWNRAAEIIDEVRIPVGKGKARTLRDKQFNGFNHRKVYDNLPQVANRNGYAFFVRPELYLNRFNLLRNRHLARLITNNDWSIQQWVRSTLDPHIGKEEGVHTPLCDNANAHIPLLSNMLKTMSPPPSVVMGVGSSERGIMKEVHTMPDDTIYNFDSYDITTTFRNMNGNPFLILFYSWMLVMCLQYLGTIAPRRIDTFQRRMNFTSRIYRLVMDHTNTYVTNIWAPIYCFPKTIEVGSIFKYDEAQPINDDMKNVDITWQCNGSIYDDPLLMMQFNQTVCLQNWKMYDQSRNTQMVRLEGPALNVFNHYAYPRINISTSALEWWVDRRLYEATEIHKSRTITNLLPNNKLPDEERQSIEGKTSYDDIAPKEDFVDKMDDVLMARYEARAKQDYINSAKKVNPSKYVTDRPDTPTDIFFGHDEQKEPYIVKLKRRLEDIKRGRVKYSGNK